MAKYTTKQRMLLLDFLSEHIDETLSAGQIAEALSGKRISTSAIYRNLAALEQEGKLKRSAKPGSQEAYYRYTGDEDCRGAPASELPALRKDRTYRRPHHQRHGKPLPCRYSQWDASGPGRLS